MHDRLNWCWVSVRWCVYMLCSKCGTGASIWVALVDI